MSARKPAATSANGWPVLDGGVGGPHPRLRKWVIPTTGRHLLLRDGSAGLLLSVVALRFDELVEDLDGGTWDEWGYALRAIRGKTSGYSNHASGTAADLNATRHPLGKRGTFTDYRKGRVHATIADLEGTVRWGGDYRGRVDEMHFEINRPLAAVEHVARALCNGKHDRVDRILEANPGARQVVFS